MSLETREKVMAKLTEMDVPVHLHRGITAYVVDHHAVGHFLTAVFENDLFEVINRADGTSLKALDKIVQFVFSYADADCHGSKQKMWDWLNPEERSKLPPPPPPPPVQIRKEGDTRSPLSEGTVRKGGRNEPPKTPRPDDPKPQSSGAS